MLELLVGLVVCSVCIFLLFHIGDLIGRLIDPERITWQGWGDRIIMSTLWVTIFLHVVAILILIFIGIHTFGEFILTLF